MKKLILVILLTFPLIHNGLCQEEGIKADDDQAANKFCKVKIYEQDSLKVYFGIRDKFDSYMFYFTSTLGFGYTSYYCFKTSSEKSYFFENDIYGESFVGDKIYVLRGFTLSKKMFKELKREDVKEIKLINFETYLPKPEKNRELYKIITIPIKDKELIKLALVRLEQE